MADTIKKEVLDKSTPTKTKTSKQKITMERIKKAKETFKVYKAAKDSYNAKVVSNEKWYKLRHWDEMAKDNSEVKDDSAPVSAWLFNSLMNKHADAMDNYPEIKVLPREPSDKSEATKLSSIMPVVLEHNDYEEVFDTAELDKLCYGTAVKGIFWGADKLNGFGDIDIKNIDILNLYWQPNINDIQDSQNVFLLEQESKELIKAKYNLTDEQLEDDDKDFTKHTGAKDENDKENNVVIYNWYYKVKDGTKTILHYCKFVGDTILEASENNPMYKDGYYEHSKYPFVFNTMFKVKGTLGGMGYIDIMKSPQAQIDLFGKQINEILEEMIPRYFIKSQGGLNKEQLANKKEKYVEVTGAGGVSDEYIRPMVQPRLDSNLFNIVTYKVDELKKTSGNRDFSQGGTTGGITAASAIAALQEAGSKLSRDANKASYRAFKKECELIIELIRQFYDDGRYFRIIGDELKNVEDGSIEDEFILYDNSKIKMQKEQLGEQDYYRLPLFDLKVKAQRSNPFKTLAHNELMLQFYGLGLLEPANSDKALVLLKSMDFEGKEELIKEIEKNGTLFAQNQMLQQQLQGMATGLDMLTGENVTDDVVMQNAEMNQEGKAPRNAGNLKALPKESSVTSNARQRVSDASSPE